MAPPLQEDLLQQPLFLAVPSTHSRALAEPLNSTVTHMHTTPHPPPSAPPPPNPCLPPPQVLRCLMPAYPQVGPVHLCLEALDGTPLTPLTTQPFHYRAAPTNAHRPLPDTGTSSCSLISAHPSGGADACPMLVMCIQCSELQQSAAEV